MLEPDHEEMADSCSETGSSGGKGPSPEFSQRLNQKQTFFVAVAFFLMAKV